MSIAYRFRRAPYIERMANKMKTLKKYKNGSHNQMVQHEESEEKKHIKEQIIQYAACQNLTREKWERKKLILYIALQNCFGDLDN